MEWEEELLVTKKEIKVSDVYDVVSEITKIPVKKLDTKEYKNLIELDKRLKRAVVGQDDAIDNVVKFIKRNTVGIRENHKPIGTGFKPFSNFSLPDGKNKGKIALEIKDLKNL